MSARTILKHLYEEGRMTEYQYERIDRVLKERERPHGEWISKPKRVQVDETDEERIFETKLEWFCSSCAKSFGNCKPDDSFCKYCGSDNRPKIHGCIFASEECKKNPCKDCGLKEGEEK